MKKNKHGGPFFIMLCAVSIEAISSLYASPGNLPSFVITSLAFLILITAALL